MISIFIQRNVREWFYENRGWKFLSRWTRNSCAFCIIGDVHICFQTYHIWIIILNICEPLQNVYSALLYYISLSPRLWQLPLSTFVYFELKTIRSFCTSQKKWLYIYGKDVLVIVPLQFAGLLSCRKEINIFGDIFFLKKFIVSSYTEMTLIFFLLLFIFGELQLSRRQGLSLL